MNPLEEIRILVVGDIMLDKYIEGEVERISPEAPVPIIKKTGGYETLGGCGNVVRNIARLCAGVDCVSVVGADDDSDVIYSHLSGLGVGFYPLVLDDYKTISKTRIIASERKVQMLRIDDENTSLETRITINEEMEDHLFDLKRDLCDYYNFIIFSDYDKGVLQPNLVEFFYSFDIPVICDIKPQNFSLCHKAYMVTPNLKEFKEIQRSQYKYLLNQIPYTLITKGKNGMELRDFNQSVDIPAEEVHNIYNVSGAGDTVVAIMAVCLSMGLSPIQSAKIANQCAGYVVTQPGTSTVPRDYFQKVLCSYT
jgi:rfaE bifunctional protein kinase chain/domain